MVTGSIHSPPISSLLSLQSIRGWICSVLVGGGYMVHRMLWCTIIVDRRGSSETSAPRPSIFTSDSLPSCTINSRLREPLYPSSSTTHQGTRYLRKPNPEMSKCIYNVIHAYKSRNIWIVCKMYIYLEWNQLTIVFYVYEQHITSCPMITKHHTTMHNTQLDHITKNGSRGSYSQR